MTRTLNVLLILTFLLMQGSRAWAQESLVQSVSPATARQRLSTLALPGLSAGEPVKCGLAVIAHATRTRAGLSQDLQSALARILQRVERQKSKTFEHFTIHYDTAGSQAAAMLDASYQHIPGSADEYADSVGAIAERVYDFETRILGYSIPPTDGNGGGGPQYDIYIEDLSNEYGETVPETQLDTKPEGGRYITFMRIDNDFSFVRPATNKGLPALRVTLAHEFHHAIQLGAYAYWSEDMFFHELTSTWMEDVVFPGVDDYVNYLKASWGHFRNPGISFSSNDNIMYSRSIWGHFIAAKFGPDVMRSAWEKARTARPLVAMDQALQAMTPNPSNFKIEFLDWVLWNYYTGSRADPTRFYPKGAIYPEVAQLPHEFVAPSGLLTGDLQGLSAHYRDVHTSADTVVLIQSNVNFDAAVAQSGAYFGYTIDLSSSQSDNTYEQAGNVLFFKTTVSDPPNWKTVKIIQGIPSYTGFAEGVPFPNPFRPDGRGVVFIPAQADHGVLYIYSSSMDLVYKAEETAVSRFQKRLFTWDGTRLNNDLAGSGIYVFVLSIPGKTITGKIALIRK